MELMDAIRDRRAVRRYTPQDVPDALVADLIEAAVWAPSAVNQQPWAFLAVRGRSRLAAFSERAKEHLFAVLPQALELHERSDELRQPGYNVFHGAGVLITVLAKPARYAPAEDCCLAAENLMLAAHGFGLGTCPVGFVRPWLNLSDVKDELGIPQNYEAVMPIVVGFPADAPVAGFRLPPQIAAWLSFPEKAAAAKL